MSMKKEHSVLTADVVVIGGGPAGMLSAITAAEQGQKVILVEANGRLGKKLLITGKGRCNVTNHCSVEDVLQNVPRNARFLYSALQAFPPEKVMAFFNDNGCPLKTERGNRVLPVSDRSVSVLECLQRRLKQTNVNVFYGKVLRILTQEQSVTGVLTDRGELLANAVVLATGGVSYPATGSTGDGYAMAEELGHKIVAPEGSLVPLETAGTDCQSMQGLSLRNVGVRLLNEKGKLLYKDFGELLFTHFGVSGPTVLSASAHMKQGNCRLVIDLKPALDEEKLNSRLLRDLQQYQNRTMENALTDLLPRSMIPVILKRAQIPAQLQANSLTKQQRRALLEQLKSFTVEITGKRPVAEAIITSGGVAVQQVDPKTMESKLVKGLYFAGEILDCDAYTGGFNLQIAWSTGYAAGLAAAREGKAPIDKPDAI